MVADNLMYMYMYMFLLCVHMIYEAQCRHDLK